MLGFGMVKGEFGKLTRAELVRFDCTSKLKSLSQQQLRDSKYRNMKRIKDCQQKIV